MSVSRFPLRKYLKQIADMEYDLRMWRYRYENESAKSENIYGAIRREQRIEILQRIEPQLHQLFHELEQLPRLS